MRAILDILRQAPEQTFVDIRPEDLTTPASDPRYSSAFSEAIALASAEGMAFGPLHGLTLKKFSRFKRAPRPRGKRDLDPIIAPYGVEVQHERGSGYFYFTDLVTGDQVGESVFVCYYADLDINRWAEEAAAARLSATQQN